jgi:hypothetical protein
VPEHLVEVLGHRDELDAHVVVISFAIPEMLRLYRAELPLGDVGLVSDIDRAAYAAFGFGRAAAARVWLDRGCGGRTRGCWREAGVRNPRRTTRCSSAVTSSSVPAAASAGSTAAAVRRTARRSTRCWPPGGPHE